MDKIKNQIRRIAIICMKNQEHIECIMEHALHFWHLIEHLLHS